jgi:NCAIR mutase (PurE)-related protein
MEQHMRRPFFAVDAVLNNRSEQIGVFAGAIPDVERASWPLATQRTELTIPGAPADVLVVGVPRNFHYGMGMGSNPILMMQAIGSSLARAKRALKPYPVVIAAAVCDGWFNETEFPPYEAAYELLQRHNNVAELAAEEDPFCANAEYIYKYRFAYGYHPFHAFSMMYMGGLGRQLTSALADIPTHGFDDIGCARIDTHRALRTGEPEVVYGAGKTPAQIVAILGALRDKGGAALATRLSPEAMAKISESFAEAVVDPVARCARLGEPERHEPERTVCIVAAGTSDLPATAEAAFTAETFGVTVQTIVDVGVAGIHRLLAVRETLAAADCLVVVAGMEGALPSVVAGLVGTPMIAVPTSVGYGASFGGIAALLGMLTSCAPGVTVVNIDNGFGAALAAVRVAKRACHRDRTP